MSAKEEIDTEDPAKKAASTKATAKKKIAGKAPPTQESDGKAPPSNPKVVAKQDSHRIRVAELAAQIASAQIVAHATHQAAIDVVTAQREMVVAGLEVLAKMSGPPQAEANQLRGTGLAGEIGDKIRLLRKRIKMPEVLESLGSPEMEPLFASAMQCAQKLLVPPEVDRRTVWAEQLFEPDEILSENEIWNRFSGYGWERKRSRGSVIELMTAVDRWFSEHHADLARGHGKDFREAQQERESDELKLLGEALALCKRRAEDFHNVRQPKFKEIADALANLLIRDIRLDIPMLGSAMGDAWGRAQTMQLIREFYQGEIPVPRVVESGNSSQDESKTKSPTRAYTAWAVFRYLRCFAGGLGDKAGYSIKAEIRTRVSGLDPRKVVNLKALLPSDYGFGPIEDQWTSFHPALDEETDGTAEELAEEMGWD